MKKVMAFGTFDILHPGHTFFLTEAKKMGDYLVVVVGLDATVEAVKGKRPRNSEQSRRLAVNNLGIADEVRLGNSGDKYKVIRDELPDVIALGYDQKFFIDDLEKNVGSKVKIVRLDSFMPEKYKSSKMA